MKDNDFKKMADSAKENQNVAIKKYIESGAKGMVMAFGNGNPELDDALTVIDTSGQSHTCMCHSIYLYHDKVYDLDNGYNGTEFSGYIKMLAENNPKLRILPRMTTGYLVVTE